MSIVPPAIGKLECPAIEPERMGAPEAAQENVLGVPR